MKTILLTFILFFSHLIKCDAQIIVDKAGDNWDFKVNEALAKIKSIDSTQYKQITQFCGKISFWNGKYSTNDGTYNERGGILISTNDMKINSINNIVAIIVHESVHLSYRYYGIDESDKEEIRCYLVEYNFLMKIPNVEQYLLDHCLEQIMKRN
jgi:hypothetical protein